MKYVSPSIKEKAFNCPHCRAFTTQFWFKVLVCPYSSEHALPAIPSAEEHARANYDDIEDVETRDKMIDWIEQMLTGLPFIRKQNQSSYVNSELNNCSVSECYNCSEVALWVFDKMVFPVVGATLAPNIDMPDDIKRDYEEAGSILNQSPRGAAALLRLAIQKLCKELGQPGKDINEDIKSLVKGGLDPRVQQALDTVRVIGNSAVHPGKIDMKDDRATAEALFKLLNLIVDKTISEPKHVKEMYESLPGNLLEAIAKRDAPKG